MKKEHLHKLRQMAFMVMLFVLGGQVSSSAQCSAAFTYTYDSTGTVLEFTPTWTAAASVVNMSWSFGDGTSASNQQPTHTYNFSGYAWVCFTINFSDSCSASYCDTVLTRQGAAGSCAANYSYTVSPSGAVSFTDNSTSTDSIISYNWDFGDGSSGTGLNPSHVYAASGTYQTCLTIATTGICADTYCSTITIQNSGGGCSADFTFVPVLGTTSVDFTDFSIADSGSTIVSYSWDFGDSTSISTVQNPNHVYPGPGLYYTCLTIVTSSGCSNTYCTTVNAGGANSCTASFGSSFNPATNAIDFADYSVTNDSIVRWEWTFGDGSTSLQQNPNHVYSAIGSYNVCLTITTASGCTNTYCSNVYYSGPQNCSAVFSGVISSSNAVFV